MRKIIAPEERHIYSICKIEPAKEFSVLKN